MSESDAKSESVPPTISIDAVPVAIDIACPGCEYNLRGLPGPVVDCPECGLQSDVSELAARQWDKPWYKAPGFNTLMWPAACVGFGWIFVIPFTAASSSGRQAALAAITAVLALWGYLMYRAYNVFGSMVGVWLALAMHLLVVGYLVGVIGFAVVVVLGLSGLAQSPAGFMPYLYGTLTLFGFMLILWVSRRIERAIAGACIRHHLRRKPTA